MIRKRCYGELGSRPFRNFRAGGSALDKFRMISLGNKFKKEGKRSGKSAKLIRGLTIEVCKLNSHFSKYFSESPGGSRPQSTLHQRLNLDIKEPKVNLSSKALTTNASNKLNLNFKATRINSTPKLTNSNTPSPQKRFKKILITRIPQALLHFP